MGYDKEIRYRDPTPDEENAEIATILGVAPKHLAINRTGGKVVAVKISDEIGMPSRTKLDALNALLESRGRKAE